MAVFVSPPKSQPHRTPKPPTEQTTKNPRTIHRADPKESFVFSLLTPFALWLAPLLAVPLVLHFMGRTEPKTRDFPSLLPVQESLRRAMRRHRVKNWLQLILRTLALLCLLLAAAGPVWRTGSTLQPPSVAGLLLHNGAYAGALDEHGQTLITRQKSLRAALDSLTEGRVFTEFLLAGASEPLNGELAMRYGHPGEAMARLFRRTGENTGDHDPVHIFVPVFNASDLAALSATARPWLESRPQARLMILDHTGHTLRLQAFGEVRAVFEREGLLTLRVATTAQHPPVWTSRSGAGETVRTAQLRDDTAVVVVPLPTGSVSARAGTGPEWIAGAFSLAESDPTRATHALTGVATAFRIPPPATLCHLGPRGAIASLASLGEGGPRLRIASLSSAAEVDRHNCRLLYLADPYDLDANLLASAAAVVRSGGRLILETGPRTDPVLWNRNLLVPLGVGRLTTVENSATPAAARARHDALSQLGIRARDVDRWGKPGTVTTRLGFLPTAGTGVLLATAGTRNQTSQSGKTRQRGHETSPLLVHRRLGSGDILLWTTSLSNPAWSDLGLGPWPALMHQAFLEQAGTGGIEPRTVDTDSLVFLPSADENPPRVMDPDGNPFSRLRAEAGGWIAGPFDQPGLYRVEGSSWLAAGLATPPATPTIADWNTFRESLGETARERTTRIDGDKDWRGLYGGLRLRLGLLLITALLLFAEGIVSLRLSPFLPALRNESTRNT
jgi:hypothetical protein